MVKQAALLILVSAVTVPLWSAAQDKPLVLSTCSMISDIASNVGGDNFRYISIVPVGSDPHLYDPTPSDARTCNAASLILLNGLTFEGWLGELVANSGTEAAQIVVTQGVVPVASLTYTKATDPHAWMDASNGLIYAQNIRDALLRLRPELTDEITDNYHRYKQEIEELDQYITRRIQEIPTEKRILITSHDAFQYYGRRYGLQLEAIMGTSTDADVQTSDIRRLNQLIRSTTVPAVFIESTINPRLLGQIAEDNGIIVGGKLFADSLGDEEGEAGTYLGMLRYDTDVICNGLQLTRTATEHHGGTSVGFSWLWVLLLSPIVFAGALFLYRFAKQQ